MTGQRHHTTDTEAVALFHDVKSLQAAIDELLTSGFDQGCLSVLGNEKAIEDKLGHSYGSTRDLEDNPNVPRATWVPDESTCGGRQHRYACLAQGLLGAAFSGLQPVSSFALSMGLFRSCLLSR
jgi:hypothetical protein